MKPHSVLTGTGPCDSSLALCHEQRCKARLIRDCLELSSWDARMDSSSSSSLLSFFPLAFFSFSPLSPSLSLSLLIIGSVTKCHSSLTCIHPSIHLLVHPLCLLVIPVCSPCGPKFPSRFFSRFQVILSPSSSFPEPFYEDTLRPVFSSAFTMSLEKVRRGKFAPFTLYSSSLFALLHSSLFKCPQWSLVIGHWSLALISHSVTFDGGNALTLAAVVEELVAVITSVIMPAPSEKLQLLRKERKKEKRRRGSQS